MKDQTTVPQSESQAECGNNTQTQITKSTKIPQNKSTNSYPKPPRHVMSATTRKTSKPAHEHQNRSIEPQSRETSKQLNELKPNSFRVTQNPKQQQICLSQHTSHTHSPSIENLRSVMESTFTDSTFDVVKENQSSSS
ncbi:hypothetical protein Droror1_Dr00002220 [Drosera rotundifolia]